MLRAVPRKTNRTFVNTPACECCRHITWCEVLDDELIYDVWEMCPMSKCLESFCPRCRAETQVIEAAR